MITSMRTIAIGRRGVAGLAVCGLLAAFAASEAAAQQLRFGHIQAPTSANHQGAELFAERVAEYTDGRVSVQIYPSAQLGDVGTLITSVRTGGLDIAEATYPLLGDFVPLYSIYVAGYFFDGWDDLQVLLEHPEFGQAWNQELLETASIRLLGTHFYGARQLTTTDVPVYGPDDIAGMRIRAVPNEMSLAVIRGLGGAPTPVPFPELFQGLRQGVVDGQENPLPTISSQRFYEVQNYLMLTSHQLIPLPWIINERSLQRLSEEDREAVLRAADEAMDWITEEIIRQEESLVEDLKERGMTVITAEDGLDLDAFRERVRAEVFATFDGAIWPEGLAEQVVEAVQ